CARRPRCGFGCDRSAGKPVRSRPLPSRSSVSPPCVFARYEMAPPGNRGLTDDRASFPSYLVLFISTAVSAPLLSQFAVQAAVSRGPLSRAAAERLILYIPRAVASGRLRRHLAA